MSETIATPKVLILNNEIMPYRIPLFKQLAKLRHILVFYSTKRSDERHWTLNEAELVYPYRILQGWVFKLPKPNYGEWRRIWLNPSLLFELWREKPSVIIAYEYSLPAFTAYLYSKMTACAFIVWSEMTPHTSRQLSWGQKFLRRLLLGHSDAVLGTSKAACEYFLAQGIGQEGIFLAPQTLNLRTWQSPKTEHPPTLLYVGHLIERKGLRYLIAAFRLLLAEMPNATLLLVGDGDLQADLEAETRQLGTAIAFLGFREQAELPAIYASADVFVLPSLEDTFAVVAAEALVAGLALIVSPYAGISSHLEHEQNALIVEPRDSQALALAMARLLSDADLRQHFLNNSQSLIQSLSPEHNAEIFAAAIDYALKQRNRHG